MKKVFVLLLVSLLVLACGEKVDTAPTKGHAEQAKDYVEVIYFHSKQRCMTCRSIERNTNELLSQLCQTNEGRQGGLSRDRHF